ncbi:cell division protein ZipA [Shewanella sairae]|uniref:Cell division protein ZipA n=1 Tax=Shewanella sairae TaxID=190310 RepID=A0ABQ4PJX1_9GAMM|nr:cell division protein ZipA [Shewanella sairae]MCL1130722.1 cell division protein ZipA [Shewanella sairae]GIU47833.1 cell division protein ZipA [Shewanella sairae]
MENLQLVLLLIGAIAIIAVLVHGFWSIRKQQPKGYKQGAMADISRERRDADGFDYDGIGEVRVIKANSMDAAAIPEHEPKVSVAEEVDNSFELSQEPQAKVSKTRVEPSLSAEAPGSTNEELPLQASLFATEEQVEELAAAVVEPTPTQESVTKVTQEEELADPRDVLVLHVVAKDGEELNGAELLPCLLTLNFKFGEMNIFHRHEDNAGTGKVLFSMANMVKPGVFDPDSMEQFTTQGVVLFMTLPCHGDALMNFSIMLNSAHQIADDLDGVLLDGGRDEWLESTKQDYIQRIRAQI